MINLTDIKQIAKNNEAIGFAKWYNSITLWKYNALLKRHSYLTFDRLGKGYYRQLSPGWQYSQPPNDLFPISALDSVE